MTFMTGSYLHTDDSSLVISSHCSFKHAVLLGATGDEIVVGNDVLIGPNVVLRAADHVFARAVLLLVANIIDLIVLRLVPMFGLRQMWW